MARELQTLRCEWTEPWSFMPVASTGWPASPPALHQSEPCFEFGLEGPFDFWCCPQEGEGEEQKKRWQRGEAVGRRD